ncbi:hypothetical protein E5288_WYG007105 [Bos mutus]|uniref:Uncharacterized protein n=1 Tax=Bos mutus TaxID=72004 RepID=A0A6B0QQ37_9CETA|nr:hypothetical protein [Bos mutus]
MDRVSRGLGFLETRVAAVSEAALHQFCVEEASPTAQRNEHRGRVSTCQPRSQTERPPRDSVPIAVTGSLKIPPPGTVSVLIMRGSEVFKIKHRSDCDGYAISKGPLHVMETSHDKKYVYTEEC